MKMPKKTISKIQDIEKIRSSDYKGFSRARIDVYGVKMHFYARDPWLIRFVKRKFSLVKNYKANHKDAILNKSINVMLKTASKRPTINELHCMDTDINSLIASTLMDTCVFFHASCATSKKDYLIFPGMSMAGKSTIATFLGQRGLALWADDNFILSHKSSRPVFFPTFGNLRTRGTMLSNIKGSIIGYIYEASDQDFKKIYNLERYLYRNALRGASKIKKLNFIFIKGRTNGKPCLEVADKMHPKTVRLFFKFIQTRYTILSKKKKIGKISEIMDLYVKSYIYLLTMGTPEATADLILKRFG